MYVNNVIIYFVSVLYKVVRVNGCDNVGIFVYECVVL